MKRGDKVKVSSRYFNEFNDMTGTVVSVVDKDYHIVVEFDVEWSVQGLKVFDKYELKKLNYDKI